MLFPPFGIVDNCYLHKINALSEPTCHFCGDSDGSLVHLRYHCPDRDLVHARQQHEEQSLQAEILQNCSKIQNHLLLGIPSRLHAAPTQPYWGDAEMCESDLPNNTLVAFGCDKSYCNDVTGLTNEIDTS